MSMATRSNAARRKKTRLYVSIITKHCTSQRGARMNEMDIQKLVIVLDAIRDNQKLQLDRQLEALTLQREQVAIVPLPCPAVLACACSYRAKRGRRSQPAVGCRRLHAATTRARAVGPAWTARRREQRHSQVRPVPRTTPTRPSAPRRPKSRTDG